MQKPSKISGFPEWLPEQKLIEERLCDAIREIYRAHGFVPIETPAVERVEVLTSKGVASKEIYTLRRLQAEDDVDAELALHFDLTVPFARYTAQHYNDLTFPFKRYQLQKVWRGERPQKGRAREFYQFDADIIARDQLPLACDAELLAVIDKIFSTIDIGDYTISINHRGVLRGMYESLGVPATSVSDAIAVVDKLAKIGSEKVKDELISLGIGDSVADEILVVSDNRVLFETLKDRKNFKISFANETFRAGMADLVEIESYIPDEFKSKMYLDLSLARGLDYYTGLIVEVRFKKYPEFGSVCGGGRYENLASEFTKQSLPGVGISVGLTRIMELIVAKEIAASKHSGVADVLFAVYSDEQRSQVNICAETLRKSGVKVCVYPASPKLGKQIEYADKLSIPFVAFLDPEGGKLSIKNLESKEQVEVEDVQQWVRSTLCSATTS